MPAHLLHGDGFLVSQELKGIQDQVGPPEVLEANSHRLQGSQLNPAQLRAVTDAVPFLAEYRLVLVEGLFGLYNPPEGRRRASRPPGRAAAHGPQVATWEMLPRYIGEEMPPTTLLVFLETSVSTGNPLLKTLKQSVNVQGLPTPTGEGLARWIRNRAAEKEGKITPGAIRLLSQFVGGNLWAMDGELEKLALYAMGRSIEEADVRLLVSQSREASIFMAVDALLEGRSATALGLMHRLRADGAEFPYIVAMIARQLRLVTLARDLMDRGHRDTEISQRVGLGPEFAARRTNEMARKQSRAGLRRLYSLLLEADLAVKRGRMGQDLALELLVSRASRPGTGPDHVPGRAGGGPRLHSVLGSTRPYSTAL